jgi:hypothetical protein
MKHFYPIIIIAVATFIGEGCKREQRVKAKIFERKELPGNKLMIKYIYQIDNSSFRDSATIKNIVINEDSIEVKINSSKPAKTIPVIGNY